MNRCQYCGAELDGLFCSHCGRAASQSPDHAANETAANHAPAHEQQTKVFVPPQPPMQPPKKSKGPLIAILIVLALCLIAVVLVLVNVLLSTSKNYLDSSSAQVSLSDQTPGSDLSDSLDKTETGSNKAEIKTYPSGTYEAGVDIPYGEYLITASGKSYFRLFEDGAGPDDLILWDSSFSGQAYVTISNGQYLSFIGTAALASDLPPYSSVDGYYPEGMYLVGKDIPPGQYRLIPTGTTGYYAVSADSTGSEDSWVNQEEFESELSVSVTTGQYLTMLDAEILP